MEEGYLQNKIREQAEDIRELKNKIKELEIKTTWSKKNYEDAAVLMWKTAEMDSYKKRLADEVIEIIKKQTELAIKKV